MAVFTWIPSYSSAAKVRVRMKKTQFGDGYQQRGPDGINAVIRDWELVFNKRTDEDADAIEAFLEANLDGSITWAPPFTWPDPIPDPPPVPPTYQYVCDTWKRVEAGPDTNDLTLTFERVFE